MTCTFMHDVMTHITISTLFVCSFYQTLVSLPVRTKQHYLLYKDLQLTFEIAGFYIESDARNNVASCLSYVSFRVHYIEDPIHTAK